MTAPQDHALGRVLAELPPERLQPYLVATGQDKRAALARYFWNVAACQAFYPLLQHLEVRLRHRLDAAITGLVSAEWSHGVPEPAYRCWIDMKPSILFHRNWEDQVRGGVRDADRAVREAKRGQRVPGDLVAAMNFGFWTSLVHEDYGDASERKASLKTIKGVQVDERKPAPLPLWPALREQVFPGAQGIELHVLSATFNEIRKFRNRVFHHEPIWRKSFTAGAKLVDRWQTLETAARWLGGEWALIGPQFYKPPTVVTNPANALIEVDSALRDAVQSYLDSVAK